MKIFIIILFLIFSPLTYTLEEEQGEGKGVGFIPYELYTKQLKETIKEYKDKILEHWSHAELPTNHKWVQYSHDYKEKCVVDFKNEKIMINVIVPEDNHLHHSNKKIMENVKEMLKQDLKESSKKTPYMNDNHVIDSDELLVGDIYDLAGDTPEESEKKIDKMISESKPVIKKAKKKGEVIVELSIPFPKDGILKKAAKYKKEVEKRAKEYEIKESLIYAVIHSESWYNPFARSSVPAYGLMQIVPKTSGKDVSKRIYGKVILFTPKYLYNSKNNIEAGTNYLNLLYYTYFGDIENEISRKYCTIASYNTGAGNVSRAILGKIDLPKTIDKINKMTSDEVYNRLIKHLPYKETKEYLKAVNTRDIYYQEIIEDI